MGNSKSVIRKLSEKSHKRSKRFNCFALLNCLKSDETENNYEEIDFDKEPPKRQIYLREDVSVDYCLLHDQAELLKQLTEEEITLCHTKDSIDYLLNIAKELRATGYKLSDECLINIFLSKLDNSFDFVLREIYDSKSKLTIGLLRWKILERINTQYLCFHCKTWLPTVYCGSCLANSVTERKSEIRNGKEFDVIYNYDLKTIE